MFRMCGTKSVLFGAILVWLACVCLVPAKAQITNPLEVSALKAIRTKLIDPLGKLNSWDHGDPCISNWKAIICYNSTFGDGYLHVEELQLLRMNLSGSLAPELGHLSYMKILDVMWNKINGSIPREVGNITSLELLLVNGNQLSGSLPDEIGNLPNLNRIQIDQNHISGPIPKSFANLNRTKHFHMNNNSLTGQIPSELARLPRLVHLLLDNNNLTGTLPSELYKLPNLLILQLDNNNFSGSTIPASYGNMTKLLKIDLSGNHLTGPIPSNKLSDNITTIDLSNNSLTGPIPSKFSGLPNLQRLFLENNNLNGSVPPSIWKNIIFTGNRSLVVNFQNNFLTNISGPIQPPANATILLYGNPVCANQLVIVPFCQFAIANEKDGMSTNSKIGCQPCPKELEYEYNTLSPIPCLCSIPIEVGYRLKSPGFSDFLPYVHDFEKYLTSRLEIDISQLTIVNFSWEEGPRLKMSLKIFPDRINIFNTSEVQRIKSMFTGWLIRTSDIFGPYELININITSYENGIPNLSPSGLSKGAVAGIVLGSIAVAVSITAGVMILIMRKHSRYGAVNRKRSKSKIPIKIDGVKDFTFEEMSMVTNNFNAQVGEGGYGKVYKGVLADGTIVAIKRAQEGSLQGSKEFYTEIELLSRLHHRNLVSLLGYCDEQDEQMLVYMDNEFMPNGTLRDHLSVTSKEPLTFSMRLSISLGSARGILYLHTEADPPIFHRDIKTSNILLD